MGNAVAANDRVSPAYSVVSGGAASQEKQDGEDDLKIRVLAFDTWLWETCGKDERVVQLLAASDAVPHEFAFVMDDYLDTCRTAVEHCELIRDARYKLVPKKISEIEFWRIFIFHFTQFLSRERQLLSSNPDNSECTGHRPAEITKESNLETDEVEQLLVSIRETFVYAVPPRRLSAGYHAQEWGLEHPMWQGQIRIVAKADNIIIRLVDASGALFAQSMELPGRELTGPSPVRPQTFYIEPVIDSSRYFVIRFLNPVSKQQALLGVGFRERSDAFDMIASINDHFARLRRLNELVARPAESHDTTTLEESPDEYKLSSTIRISDFAANSSSCEASKSLGQFSDATLRHLPLTLTPPRSVQVPLISDADGWSDFLTADKVFGGTV